MKSRDLSLLLCKRRSSRQIGLYRKVADDYDRMALLVNDRRLRNMFLGFAQQWREAALEADALGMLDQLKPMEENDHVSWLQQLRA
jgi:hypothetical protein